MSDKQNMTNKSFLKKYFNQFKALIEPTDVLLENLSSFAQSLKKMHSNGNKALIVGNGGSAAMASHVAVDVTKAARIRSINFNESDLITCLANDFGYENWVAKAIEYYADANDLVILISSSGQSENILNGAKKAQSMRIPLITFSGFSAENPLRKLGELNLWVNSSEYNIVEMTHHIWLLAIVDSIILSKK